MKAMILAAGLGKRMRPLTTVRPKPLLKVNNKALIDYHLERIAELGVVDVVINHYWLGEQIEAHIGDGSQWGLHVQYSAEDELLDTAGGMINALPLLGEDPFLLINGDIWCNYPLQQLLERPVQEAHLVMVDNPQHNDGGDFYLREGQLFTQQPGTALTYAGLGLIRPTLFAGSEGGCKPLRPFLESAIERGAISGEHYRGEWVDVGTPERLKELDTRVSTAFV